MPLAFDFSHAKDAGKRPCGLLLCFAGTPPLSPHLHWLVSDSLLLILLCFWLHFFSFCLIRPFSVFSFRFVCCVNVVARINTALKL